MKKFQKVKVHRSPVSDRYFYPGMLALYDTELRMMRMAGCWFDVDHRWDFEEMKGKLKKKHKKKERKK